MCWEEPCAEFLPRWSSAQLRDFVSDLQTGGLCGTQGVECTSGEDRKCTFITGWTGNSQTHNSKNCSAGPTEVLDTPAPGQEGDWEQSEESVKGFVEWHWHF